MADNSSIEWTEATWNPVVGCTKISPGCAHCYAERMSYRLASISRQAKDAGIDPGRTGNYARVVTKDGRWNRKMVLVEEALSEPQQWRKPRVVFVNSMSDLFHEAVPLPFIRRVFDAMSAAESHTFQVLTKRPENALRYAAELAWSPNIWLGVSVESAAYLDRIEILRRLPARVRFLSLEPLLAPLRSLPLRGIHWVIVGGESGPGARPMRAEWVEEIKAQCAARKVPFFFKQWGGVNKSKAGRLLQGRTWDEMPRSGVPAL